MTDLDRVMTADGRVLTDAETAAHAGIVKRLSWASLHWGAEDLHPDALPHIAIAAVAAAAPLIEAQALREAADDYTNHEDDHGAAMVARRWLRARAVRIARGES